MRYKATLVMTPRDPFQDRLRDYASFTSRTNDPISLMWQASRALLFPWGPDQQFVAEFSTQDDGTIAWNYQTSDYDYVVLLQSQEIPDQERRMRVFLEFMVQQPDESVIIDLETLRESMVDLVEDAVRGHVRCDDDHLVSPLLEHVAVRLVGVETD